MQQGKPQAKRDAAPLAQRRARYSSLGERIKANSVLSETNFLDSDGSPCWDWIGWIDVNGYPRISIRWKSGPRRGMVRSAKAHRVSIEVFTGRKMRKGYVGKHKCNNKRCVNPKHLTSGTQGSNIRQCVREGRHQTPFRQREPGED